MPKLVYEQNTKVHWLTTIADIAAPTLTEITAGTNLTPFITKDGVARNIATNNVDSASIDTNFDSQEVGSWGAGFQLTMFRDDGDEAESYDLVVYGTRGFLVVCPFGEPAVADQVEVYPAALHEPAPQNSAANAMQTFMVNCAITDKPNLRAVVAGP